MPLPPIDPPNVTEQAIADRDRAARAATFAVGRVVMDNHADMTVLTQVTRESVIVQTALGYLIAHRLITVTPEDEWPEWLALDCPPEMAPDVAALARRARETGIRA